MMYGYNPNYGAMMAPQYMQQPCGMQKPMMPQPCGMQQPITPQPYNMQQPYQVPTYSSPMPQNNGVMQAGQMPVTNGVTPNYGVVMPTPMPYPNAVAPVQQAPYPSYPTPTPSYPTTVNPVSPMPYPPYQTPVCQGCLKPVHNCCCGCNGGHPIPPMPPVTPIPPVTTQPVYPVPQLVEEPVMTTTNYKKTTYMEAYVPVETNVPLMQNVVEPKPTKPVQGKPVLMSETPVNNYNMYMQDRGVLMTHDPITCQNLPLAQSYIQPQTYTNLNDPDATLEQGTFFTDLYRPYMGGYLK